MSQRNTRPITNSLYVEKLAHNARRRRQLEYTAAVRGRTIKISVTGFRRVFHSRNNRDYNNNSINAGSNLTTIITLRTPTYTGQQRYIYTDPSYGFKDVLYRRLSKNILEKAGRPSAASFRI